MHMILNHSSMVPIYEQIVGRIKSQIIDGELPADTMLPSVRALSGELRISALTVKKAYDRLEEEGFVVTVHGKGTFVAGVDPATALEARRKSVEDVLADCVGKARALGMSAQDIRDILEIILEE